MFDVQKCGAALPCPQLLSICGRGKVPRGTTEPAMAIASAPRRLRKIVHAQKLHLKTVLREFAEEANGFREASGDPDRRHRREVKQMFFFGKTWRSEKQSERRVHQTPRLPAEYRHCAPGPRHRSHIPVSAIRRDSLLVREECAPFFVGTAHSWMNLPVRWGLAHLLRGTESRLGRTHRAGAPRRGPGRSRRGPWGQYPSSDSGC